MNGKGVPLMGITLLMVRRSILYLFTLRNFLARLVERLVTSIMISWRRRPWISGLILLYEEEMLIPKLGIMLGSVPLLTNVVP